MGTVAGSPKATGYSTHLDVIRTRQQSSLLHRLLLVLESVGLVLAPPPDPCCFLRKVPFEAPERASIAFFLRSFFISSITELPSGFEWKMLQISCLDISSSVLKTGYKLVLEDVFGDGGVPGAMR